MKLIQLMRYGLLALLAISLSFSTVPFAPEAQAISCSVPSRVYVNAVGGVNRVSNWFYGCWGRDSSHAFETVQAAINEMNSRGGAASTTIIYKRDNLTESFSSSSGIYYTIQPWSGYASTSGTFKITGGKNITIDGFTFTSGGVTVDGTVDNVDVTNNTFNSGSKIDITGDGEVDVEDNVFSSAYIFSHANKGRVSIWSNTFQTSAPNVTSGTTTYGRYYTVLDDQDGSVDFVGNTVSSGQAFYMEESSSGAIIMSNSMAATGSTSDTAIKIYDSSVTTIDNNTITNAGTGVSIYGVSNPSTVSWIEDNTITLVNTATSTSKGLEIGSGTTVNTVQNNSVTNADYGFFYDTSKVDVTKSNSFATTSTGIYGLAVDLGNVDSNTLNTNSVGVHIIGQSTVDTIDSNTVGDGSYGIILEASPGEFTSAYQEGTAGSVSTWQNMGTQIRKNVFNGTGTAIGLANVEIVNVRNNSMNSVKNGMLAFHSLADQFYQNTLNRSANAGSGTVGLLINDSTIEQVNRNTISDFDYGIELADDGTISTLMDANRIDRGTHGLHSEQGHILVPLTNHLFIDNTVGIFVGGITNGFNVLHSTFYSSSSIYLDGGLSTPMTIANNVFSYFDSQGAVLTNALSNLGVLDYNLYDDPVAGSYVLRESSSTYYTLKDVQALGYEAAAYEEYGTALVNPAGGDYRLNNGSRGVNSADNGYLTARDFNNLVRPFCVTSDRGAFEMNGSGAPMAGGDGDGDGLCNFQESAWGTSTTSADTDADGLSDSEEIYTHFTMPTVADTDGDTFTDKEEVDAGTDPLDAGSYPNDADRDGMDDSWETTYGLDPSVDDSAGDLDSDGLTNLEEYEAGYDPADSDMDNDGLLDGEEASYGTDVTMDDTDVDGYLDGEEVDAGTDPLDASDYPTDNDGDGIDDAVDTDDDNDGVLDADDAFPFDETEWDDSDSDGTGDNADTDDDNDGVADTDDVFPYDASEWDDSDLDGTGDNADTDDDNDGVADGSDAFPYDSSEWADFDGDGFGDNTDTDDDGDGFTDTVETGYGTDPYDASDYPVDVDGDGLDDSVDTDDDNDGVLDADDAFPYDSTEWDDSDSDGLGDNADTDDDNDGVADGSDAFPYDSTEWDDSDSDGTGDNADTDDDNDGVADGSDAFPYDSTESVDTDGDGTGNNADTDDDNDGVADGSDAFPYDSTEWDDSDSDGTGDNADTDDDNDGVADGSDAFPYDSTESVDTDGDGTGNNADTDDDGDGYSDSFEISEGTDPLDSSDYPADADMDNLSDADEASYGTDPYDSDTDDDLFRDDYEILEGSDPLDASDMPTLTVTIVGYTAISGSGNSGSFSAGAVTRYDSTVTIDMSSGTVAYGEIYYTSYGAFGVSWDEDQYLGSITVQYCGVDTAVFNPDGSSCTSITDYSSSSSPDDEPTRVSDSSQLEAWSTLSSYYTFEDWDWYRPEVFSSTKYAAFELELN